MTDTYLIAPDTPPMAMIDAMYAYCAMVGKYELVNGKLKMAPCWMYHELMAGDSSFI